MTLVEDNRTSSGLSATPKYTSNVLRSHLVRKMNNMADFYIELKSKKYRYQAIKRKEQSKLKIQKTRL